MKRLVAEYLEPRLCRDAVCVVNTPVAADGLELLHRGLMWSARYDRGRLLGEVGSWDLVVGGRRDVIDRWLAAGGEANNPLMRRALSGEQLTAAERATLWLNDRGLAVLADRMFGHRIDGDEIEAIAALATESYQHSWVADLRKLVTEPVADHTKPLSDDPAEPIAEGSDLDIYDFVSRGDHAGCLRGLAAMIERAEALDGDPRDAAWAWRKIAMLHRFLTDDDTAAMAYLSRSRFADTRSYWVEIFGDRGAARVQREKDEVLAMIEQAFDGVPYPGPEHKSLFQAEAADSYRGCDQSQDHKGRWQDIPREHFLACQWAIPHLGGHSSHYYWPAVMSFCVREHDQKLDDHGTRWIFESMEYSLQFTLDRKDINNHLKKRLRFFTPAQLAAVARFAEYYPSEPADRARWYALAAGGAWPTA